MTLRAYETAPRGTDPVDAPRLPSRQVREGGRSMDGLMQDFPLTLPHLHVRAERLFADKRLVTVSATGKTSETYGEWADRTRRLGGALATLGISDDGRVATFGWNTARHAELYFAAPCTGQIGRAHV